MPDQTLALEWSDPKKLPDQSTIRLQDEIFARFQAEPARWLLFLSFCDHHIPLSPSLDYWRRFTGLFTQRLTLTPDLELSRHNTHIAVSSDHITHLLARTPLMTGAEYTNRALLESIWQQLNQTFCDALKAFQGSVADFIKRYSPDVQLVGRIFFHLVENKKGAQPFAFLATYATRINRQGQSKHLPLKFALKEYGRDQEKLLELLATVYAAAKKSALIKMLIESGEIFSPLAWSAEEALAFLKQIPTFEQAGILCRIPNWWKGKTATVRVNMSIGDKKPSLLGMDAILSFKARLYLGDTPISVADARRLLAESEGLAFIKNRWVEVDAKKLKQTLDLYENARAMMKAGNFNLNDALRMQLDPRRLGDNDDLAASVSNGRWLESVFKKLRDPKLTPTVRPGQGFKARLRPYQHKGLNWLVFLHSLGFGACLADDMGLGKTVQLLAFLSTLGAKKKASLLVLPASLIGNWVGEIKRFYPKLSYYVAHPEAQPQKKILAKNKTALDSIDLVITTYALTQKYGWLKEYTWAYVILDEAQAIKNPGTKQTRAVKALKATNRIVMTGTPIENRLGDLWSLFDFLNPGLLGNKTEFGRFAKRLTKAPDGYGRLRRVIQPFILRRLKTDKTVISDLPDKVEMKTFAPLSKRQIVLYQNLLQELARSLAETDGIQRKGLILASLMKLKQICNHPDQYLGSGEYQEKESGKFTRLREICETIYEKRERALVFTQFKEITGPLQRHLQEIFKHEGVILHGSVPVGKRKALIERFQGDAYVPFMVLSLKAGGVGLNLTKANHVIHFDRWWNPAVENQATDRAFRIGQKKNVMVHKFLTKGTIEEKIDQMLEEKSRLSQDVIVSSGEKWITEMKNDELVDLFALTI
jgi:hypothetical protein